MICEDIMIKEKKCRYYIYTGLILFHFFYQSAQSQQLSELNRLSSQNKSAYTHTHSSILFEWQDILQTRASHRILGVDPNDMNNNSIDFSCVTTNNYYGTGKKALGNTTFKTAPKYYQWRGYESQSTGTDPWSELRNFTSDSGDLGTSELVSPKNNSIEIPLSSLLLWKAVNKAETYSVEVATSNNFSSPSTIVSKTDIAQCSLRIDNIVPSETYYWHVKAKNSTAASSWSETFTFQTVNFVLESPVLDEPKNEVLCNSSNVTVAWDAVQNAVKYTLQVSTTPDFSVSPLLLEVEHIRNCKYLLQNLSPKMYYWRVAASDISGTKSMWSSIRNFTILSASANSSQQRLYTHYSLQVVPRVVTRQSSLWFSISTLQELRGKLKIYNLNGECMFSKQCYASAGTNNVLLHVSVDKIGNGILASGIYSACFIVEYPKNYSVFKPAVFTVQ